MFKNPERARILNRSGRLLLAALLVAFGGGASCAARRVPVPDLPEPNEAPPRYLIFNDALPDSTHVCIPIESAGGPRAACVELGWIRWLLRLQRSS